MSIDFYTNRLKAFFLPSLYTDSFFIPVVFKFPGFLIYSVRYQIKIEFGFATERLEVALWQNACLKFLSGTGLNKLKNQEI